MAKMTKTQLIDAIAEATQVSKGDVKSVVEQMAVVGYKELNEAGEFVIPERLFLDHAAFRSDISSFTNSTFGVASGRAVRTNT